MRSRSVVIGSLVLCTLFLWTASNGVVLGQNIASAASVMPVSGQADVDLNNSNNNGWGWSQMMGPRTVTGQAEQSLEAAYSAKRIADAKAYFASYKRPNVVLPGATQADCDAKNAINEKRDAKGFFPAGSRPSGCVPQWGDCSGHRNIDINQQCNPGPNGIQICWQYIVPDAKYVVTLPTAPTTPAKVVPPKSPKVLTPDQQAQLKTLTTPDPDYPDKPRYAPGTRPDDVQILRNTDCKTVTLKPFQITRQNPGPICAVSYYYTEPDAAAIAAITGEAPAVAIACPLSFMEFGAEYHSSSLLQMGGRIRRGKLSSSQPGGVKTKISKASLSKVPKKGASLRSGLSAAQLQKCQEERQAYFKSKGKATPNATSNTPSKASNGAKKSVSIMKPGQVKSLSKKPKHKF